MKRSFFALTILTLLTTACQLPGVTPLSQPTAVPQIQTNSSVLPVTVNPIPLDGSLESLYQQELEISLEEAYKGTTRLLQTDGKEKQVRIPAGVRTGSKVRVAGAGPNGLDLYLIVDVQDDKRFERRGNDLHTTATVSVFTAILGGEADVETFDGKIKLNIPAGTQPEQVFRLAGRGMTHLKNPKEKGDLFVKVKVQIPKYLSPKQRELLDEASRIKF